MKKQWSMVGAIILFLGIAFLSVLNVDPVPVNFGFAEVEWPLIIIIFASVLLGALIATLLSTYRAFKDQREQKHQKSAEKSDAGPSSRAGMMRSEKSSKDRSNDEKSDSDTKSQNDDIL
ncbi:Uncharacterized integral membrane protein [Alkalibacterium subtropicum]|uniref:Uncharacterized integral membrane protein n=1 Tax=Alkalibacterium subtropicum TaxID=753702 RepID=A0A1I1EPV7_9LACT|nr:lipopolysaccharide assembly protein LapA domain-containing protein [Alkalibacterium subtropicum]SFB89111.1 Uncharacterized integral membrane protein [Alkalibacterium subtropicum]